MATPFDRRGPSRAASASPPAHFRRKVLFEALEPRLLLSGDGLALVAAAAPVGQEVVVGLALAVPVSPEVVISMARAALPQADATQAEVAGATVAPLGIGAQPTDGAAAMAAQGAAPREIVFVDAMLPDAQTLIDGLRAPSQPQGSTGQATPSAAAISFSSSRGSVCGA